MEMRRRGFLGALIGMAMSTVVTDPVAIVDKVGSVSKETVAKLNHDTWYHITVMRFAGVVSVAVNGTIVDSIEGAEVTSDADKVYIKLDDYIVCTMARTQASTFRIDAQVMKPSGAKTKVEVKLESTVT